jgi:hypothetical protein
MKNNFIQRKFPIAIRVISVLAICAVLVSCESTKSWNDKYNVKFNPEGHHNLDCSNDEATAIAAGALRRKYPEHYERFKKIGFNDWAPIYGDYKGKTIQRYTYKTVLAYKILENQSMQGSYKMESIEVSLSKSCEVLGVEYFKGKVEWII